MLYEAQCLTCEHVQDYYSSVADRAKTPACESCGHPTHQIICAPMISAMVFTGWKGFHMPDGKNGGKGTWIESGTDYKNYLKKNDVMPASEGQAEAALQKKNADEAKRKKRRKDVEKIVQERAS